jgi:serine/threonine protein phosphatase PrpC
VLPRAREQPVVHHALAFAQNSANHLAQHVVKVRVATATFAAGARCDDHVGVIRRDTWIFLALADGAGNSAEGGRAARWVVEQACTKAAEAKTVPSADVLAQWAQELDSAWFATGSNGETTLVLVVIHDAKVFGASVGDSGAWLVHSGSHHELTSEQRRRPLLGQQRATVLPFGPVAFHGVVLVASDGLLKYAAEEQIRHLATDANVSVAAAKLVDLVRTASGTLHDDVSLIVVRKTD